MALVRLVSKNPQNDGDTLMFESVASYIGAIIASNQSDLKEAKITAWIEPFEYLPIASGQEEEFRAYIIKDAAIPPGGSYESWRFAVGVFDKIYVKSNNGKVSFSFEAVLQGTT